MQFFVYFTMNENESMSAPSPEAMADMGKFMKESFDSGIIVATGQLPMQTTHVRLYKGEFSITDGPFIEGKDLIPGFTIIEVKTKEEAINWVKKLRECMGDGVMRMAHLSSTSEADLGL